MYNNAFDLNICERRVFLAGYRNLLNRIQNLKAVYYLQK